MVGILLISHGALARQLMETARMITGDHEGFAAIQLEPDQGSEYLKQEINNVYKKINSQNRGVLVLVDIFGGTPSNSAFIMTEKLDLSIVTGVNLPMLLEILLCRSGKTLEELTEIAIESGREGIKNVMRMHKKMTF